MFYCPEIQMPQLINSKLNLERRFLVVTDNKCTNNKSLSLGSRPAIKYKYT